MLDLYLNCCLSGTRGMQCKQYIWLDISPCILCMGLYLIKCIVFQEPGVCMGLYLIKFVICRNQGYAGGYGEDGKDRRSTDPQVNHSSHLHCDTVNSSHLHCDTVNHSTVTRWHCDTIIEPCQDSDSDSELDIEGPSSPSDLRDEELVCTTCSTFSTVYHDHRGNQRTFFNMSLIMLADEYEHHHIDYQR